jgi:hypothetical protein
MAALTTSAVSASADTKLERSLPTLNFGRLNNLEVDGLLQPDDDRSLVRFDAAQLKQQIGTGTVNSVTLTLAVQLPVVTVGTPQITVHRMLQDWSETTATWGSVFGANSSATPFVTSPTCTVSVQAGQLGQLSCDVTKDVIAFLVSNAPNYGWLIKDEQNGGGASLWLGSRESTTPPKLAITFSDDPIDGPTLIDASTPGTLTVDGSNGNGMLDVAQAGMVFDTQQSLIDWAIANLNAVPVVDSATGATVGVEGRLVQAGDLGYVDEQTLSLVPVDDYIAAKLGGRSGIVTVAGTQYCLRDDGCINGMTLKAAPPKSSSACSGTRYCINGDSFKTNLIIYRSVGSETDQGAGGYHESHHICWNPFKLFRCTKKSGHNTLRVSNAYTFVSNLVVGSIPDSSQKNDSTSLKLKLWSFFVSIKSSDAGVTPGTISTAEADVSGVCGAESGTDNVSRLAASTATSTGDVQGVCDGSVSGPG